MTNRFIPMMLAASFVLPAAAMAQTAAPAAPATTAPATTAVAPVAPHAMPHRVAARTGQSSTDRVEQRITDMRTKLHITAAQQPQFDAFAAVMRENATHMQQVFESRTDRFKTMTAVDNMQSYQAIAQQHAADLQKLVPAFATLYATMTDEQKHAADDMFRNASAARHATTPTRKG